MSNNKKKSAKFIEYRTQAILFEIGVDRPQDFEQAIDQWKKAAFAGDPWARKRLLELKKNPLAAAFFKENNQSQKPIALVVDDDSAILQEIVNIFADKYHVLTCNNGYEALDYLAEEDVKLFFLDLKMPKMTGVDLLNKINNPEFLDMLNIFIITGFFSPADQTKLAEFPIKGVLEKPFIKEDVIKKVSKVVQ